MGIGDVIVNVVIGLTAAVMSFVVCDIKCTRLSKVFIVVLWGLCYILDQYLLRGNATTSKWGALICIIAGAIELTPVVYTTYKCRGDFWKNMLFIMIGVQATSAVFVPICSISPTLYNILYMISGPTVGLLDIKSALIASTLYTVSAVVVTVVLCYIYKRVKEVGFYKYIVLVYCSVVTVSGVYRYISIMSYLSANIKVFVMAVNICGVVPLIFCLNAFGYAHEKCENQRIKKEAELLSHIVAEHCSRYESLRKSNETLKQIRDEYENELGNYRDNAYAESLLLHSREIDLSVHTGGLIMDSALEAINERLEKEDIKLEYTFEDSFGAGSDIIMSEMDMAYILDKLSILAVMLNKNVSQDRFVVITERKISGAEVVKVEFSKDKKTKLKLAGNRLLADKLYGKDRKEMSDMMNEIHILIGKYDGAIRIEDEGATASVSIMAR